MQQLKPPSEPVVILPERQPLPLVRGPVLSGRKYLLVLGATTFLVLAASAAFNWVMNPYHVFDPPVWQGVNDRQPFLHSQERFYKACAVIRQQPQTVILGSSRADIGLSPQHPGWTERPVFNFGIAGASLEAVARHFEHAVAVAPVKKAVIMLDYASAETRPEARPAERDPWLDHLQDGSRHSRTAARLHLALLSWSTTSTGIKTLCTRRADNVQLPDGQLDNHDCWRRLQEKQHANPRWNWETNFALGLIPFSGRLSVGRQWAHLQHIFDLAAQHDVEVTYVISPTHDLLWQRCIAEEGMETVLAWRAELLQQAHEGSRRLGRPMPVIWDFALAEGAGMSPAALMKEMKSHPDHTLPLYLECSHFTQRLGDRLLDRVLLDPAGPDPACGVRLEAHLLPGHLARLRQRWSDVPR